MLTNQLSNIKNEKFNLLENVELRACVCVYVGLYIYIYIFSAVK